MRFGPHKECIFLTINALNCYILGVNVTEGLQIVSEIRQIRESG